jgi:hypothetical protein
MKGNLIHRGNGDYRLFTEGVPYATTGGSPYKKLSQQNCDEIFGVVDVEKLADEYCTYVPKNAKELRDVNLAKLGFIDGFNKAMRLNKDKVFTLEDMLKAYEKGASFGTTKLGNTHYFDELIQSLQQPTTIEVEIVTEEFESYNEILDAVKKPILDSEGCLILKQQEQ